MPHHLRTIIIYSCAAIGCFGLVQTRAQAEPHRPVLLRVPPVYPEIALRMHVTGEVMVRAILRTDGTVSETHIESGHALLRQAAEEAVKRWKFAPATAEAPTECLVTVVFDGR